MISEIEKVNNVQAFVLAVVAAAIADEQAGIAERLPSRNSRKALIKRLNLNGYRSSPRHGDASQARSIYTAARFLYRTEQSTTTEG